MNVMPLELDPRIDTRELSNPQSSEWLPIAGVLILAAYLLSAFSMSGLSALLDQALVRHRQSGVQRATVEAPKPSPNLARNR